jgi:hypothetical protein
MDKMIRFLAICSLMYPSIQLFGTYDRYEILEPRRKQSPREEARKVLPASVISNVPPTQKQMSEREDKMRKKQVASENPLVKAAREGNLQVVQRICCSVPGRAVPEYNFFAFLAAVEARRDDVAEYLASKQPACDTYSRQHNGDELYYYLFWFSVMHGEKAGFDFFMTRRINVHQISKRRFKLYDDEEVYYNDVYVNAISFLRTGYAIYGYSEELRDIEWALGQQGLTDAPSTDYSSRDGDDGCNVQ